jgi:iron(III) transport system ATP-binding protein
MSFDVDAPLSDRAEGDRAEGDRAEGDRQLSSTTMTSGLDAFAGAAVKLACVSVAYPGERGIDIGAVDDVSLDIEPGSIVALLGPSGCGKTSLLRAIAGLEEPVRGEISIGGRVVSSRPNPTTATKRTWVQPEQRNVGMVFQDGALFPHLTTRQNIAFGLRALPTKLSREEAVTRVDGLLELVDLVGYGDRMPGTLSGGQQQRVALARSLAPRPKVLLLDEPFSALDTALRVQVRAEVSTILRDIGVTTIFVTHDQDEAFVLGDKVAVMHTGEIEQFGSPDELYRSPESPWVAGFVGEANFVAGSVADDGEATGLAATPIGTIAIEDHRVDRSEHSVRVLVRPEQVALETWPHDASHERHDSNDGVGEPATVTAVEYYGHDVRYELELDDGTSLAARTHSTELFARGDRVVASFQSRQRGSRSAAFSLKDAATPQPPQR